MFSLRSTCLTSVSTPLTILTRRSHQTASRTKRALQLPPHPTMVPDSTATATVEIIYNPPSSAASVYHTPLKFLPPSDPRKAISLTNLFGKPVTLNSLPPVIDLPYRGANPRYHLNKEQAAEIQRLRRENPVKWTVGALAKKFDCSEVFVTICTAAPREYKEGLEKRVQAVRERWGEKKREAQDQRKKRKEMLFRGEL